MAMKVVICGDSYCAPSTKHRKHFGHLLHDVYGYDVINFAQGRVSMVATALQIKEALRLFPDAVIYKNTFADRFEVPVGIDDPSFSGHFDLKHHTPGERSFYYIDRGDRKTRIVSDVIKNLLPEADSRYRNQHLSDSQRDAIKNYWVEIFNPELKSLTDHWIHQYWTGQIRELGALAVDLSEDGLGKELLEWRKKNPRHPEPYHTDPETQSIVAANIHQTLASWPGAQYQLDSDTKSWRESIWNQLANR